MRFSALVGLVLAARLGVVPAAISGASPSAPDAASTTAGATPVGPSEEPLDIRFLVLSVEPPKPVVGSCLDPETKYNYKVHPYDVVRLRVEAIQADGTFLDLTGDQMLKFVSWDRDAARVSRKGIVKFFPRHPPVRTVGIEVSAGRLTRVAMFVVVSRVDFDLPEAARRALEQAFPGFRVPGEADVVNDWTVDATGPPFAVEGDFDDNGLPDLGLVLLRGPEWKIVVLNRQEDGSYVVAYAEEGRPDTKKGMVCPQQIQLTLQQVLPEGAPPQEPHPTLHVRVQNVKVYDLVWNGKKYDPVEEHDQAPDEDGGD